MVGQEAAWQPESIKPESIKGGSVPIRIIKPPAEASAGEIVRIKVQIEPNQRRTAYRVVVEDPEEVVECSPDTILVAKEIETFEVTFKIREQVPTEARVHFALYTMDGLGKDKTPHSLTVKAAVSGAGQNAPVGAASAGAAAAAAAASAPPETRGMAGGSVPISCCPEKDEAIIHAAAGQTLFVRVNLDKPIESGQVFTVRAVDGSSEKLVNLPSDVKGLGGDTWVDVPVRIDPDASGDVAFTVTGARNESVKYILRVH